MDESNANDLRGLRQDYARGELRRADLHPDPLAQFQAWLQQALASDLPEPYAMTVATVGADGQPSARTVLLRGADEHGLAFYTNYDSRKGHDITANPRAAALFYWPGLERQVRAEGTVQRVPDEQADAYFASRPYGSRIAALASGIQSAPIETREELEARVTQLQETYPEHVPRPENWGGYLIAPERWEFWQGRPSRLHDRFQYERHAGGWTITRLTP